MSLNKKISIIILSDGASWAEGLITTILGKNFSEPHKQKTVKNTEIYENEMFNLKFIPRSPWDDVKDICRQPPAPDMCLLVVENTFSSDHVWQQVEDLSKKTEKPTEEFIVVLPFGYEPKDYIFKFWTIQQLFSELEKLGKEKQLVPNDKRCEPHTAMAPTGGSFSKEPFTDTKKSLKRKHTSIKGNLVLLGMAGTGKSASGNTILGNKVFVSKPSSVPVTTECRAEDTELKGIHIRVIDTPDIFDDDIKSSEKHVKRCKQLRQSDPCVFVLVMHVSRFTDGERDILKKLEKAFGNKVSEQMIILFTRGDDLQQGEMSFGDFLDSCQPDLKKIIEKCGKRCFVFENNRSDSDQVEKLMDTVIKMIQEQQKF